MAIVAHRVQREVQLERDVHLPRVGRHAQHDRQRADDRRQQFLEKTKVPHVLIDSRSVPFQKTIPVNLESI